VARPEDLLDTPAAGAQAVRGAGLRIAGYAVGVAITVVSAAVLFRHLGVADAGRYVLVLSIVTLTAGMTDAGLLAIGMREAAQRDGADRWTFLGDLLGLRIALALAGGGLALAYVLVAGYSATMVAGTALVCFGTLAQSVQATASVTLMTDLRLGWVTVADLLRQLVTALGIVVLAAAGVALLPFFVVVPVAALAALALTAVLVRRTAPLRPRANTANWRALLAETLPYALAVAIGVLYFRLAILLVDLIADDRQTGYFAASFRIVEVLLAVPQLMLIAGLPILARAARDDEARLRYGLQRMLEVCVILGGLAAVVFGVGAAAVIDVVAGDGFEPAVPVLRLHAVAFVFAFAVVPFAYALVALRRHREVLVMNAAALVAVSVALAILVPLDGARGGAIGTLVGELTLATGGAVLLARSGLRLDLSIVLRVALAGAAALVPAFFLPSAPAAAVAAIVFLGVLLVSRAIPEELLVEARGIARRARG
jgi:O-antigen/teichoic acid export membrane protein